MLKQIIPSKAHLGANKGGLGVQNQPCLPPKKCDKVIKNVHTKTNYPPPTKNFKPICLNFSTK